MGAFGQLESAWPVHGSILVKDDVAYFAAGRSSYLDGGIHLCALDPITGKVLDKQVLYSPDPNTGKMPSGDARTIPGVLADVLVSDGSSIYMRQEKVFSRGSENDPVARNRPHLLATGGFRDESWFNRTQWAVGAVARAQLLVFDEQTAYAIQAYPGTGRSNFFRPGDRGYLLFARLLEASSPRNSSTGGSRSRAKDKKSKQRWATRVPVRVIAMVLAGQNLFIAGPPDVVVDDDHLAAFEGRKGAGLWAVSAVDGAKLAQYELKHEPVFDGMAAAGGRLYIATANGEVLCFENADGKRLL
jgi:outer membrane protein assembly factor BamB